MPAVVVISMFNLDDNRPGMVIDNFWLRKITCYYKMACLSLWVSQRDLVI